MESDIWIAIVALCAVLFGGLLKTVKGAIDAHNSGEPFSWSKFSSSLIAMVGESAVAFLGINLTDFGVDGVGLMIIIIVCFLAGLYGSKYVGQLLASGTILLKNTVKK